jgi:hypothetical protein
LTPDGEKKRISRTTVPDTDEALAVAVVKHRQSPLINDQLMVPKRPYEREGARLAAVFAALEDH